MNNPFVQQYSFIEISSIISAFLQCLCLFNEYDCSYALNYDSSHSRTHLTLFKLYLDSKAIAKSGYSRAYLTFEHCKLSAQRFNRVIWLLPQWSFWLGASWHHMGDGQTYENLSKYILNKRYSLVGSRQVVFKAFFIMSNTVLLYPDLTVDRRTWGVAFNFRLNTIHLAFRWNLKLGIQILY